MGSVCCFYWGCSVNNSDMPSMPTKHNSEHFQHSNDYTTGLTKREHFAGLAMQGFAANSGMMMNENIAGLSVQWADELLAELDKDNGNG